MSPLDSITELLGQGAVIGAHLLSLHSAPTYTAPIEGPRFFLSDPTTEERAYRSVTPGLYLRLANGATIGAYRNSHGRGSAYAGWTFQTEDGRWALTVGGVTGYPGPAIAPLVVPSLRLGLDAVGAPGWSARIAVMPKPPRQDNGAAAIHFALERAL